MHLLALTGGIASGKSTVARRLAERGAVVIDADQLSRDVVRPGTAGLEQIRAAFGESVIAPDGTLDRAALGAIVFTDADARHTLNGIVHPAVQEESHRRFREAGRADAHAVVVYDVPLLVEARAVAEFDHVVVVSAPEAVRVGRLIHDRGMTQDEAAARIRSQASEESRLAIADTVIDSSTTLERTLEQADAVWIRAAAAAGR